MASAASAAAVDVLAPLPPPMAYAFITWDAALGRRMCPLATFGSRAPAVLRARLVCVDPPRADRELLANAADVRGAIALVVRGGCSFAQKARRLQRAGAVAMLLANNTREEPFAMFTMAADDGDAAVAAGSSSEPSPTEEQLAMPCVMMCLYDVRELFKQYPPSVQTGVLTLEIHAPARERELVAECEAHRQVAMQQQTSGDTAGGQDDSASGGGGGWGAALKRRTTSLIKRWETPMLNTIGSPRAAAVALAASPRPARDSAADPETALPMTTTPTAAVAASPSPPPPPPERPLRRLPVFAFVQWATSASAYVLFFAPLADFCLVASNAIYEGRRVACDPLRAHEDAIANAAQLADAVALVERGACTFPVKLERVQRCGAAAAIVGNDDADDEDAAFVMSVDQIRVDHLTIPSVMVSRRVFARLLHEDAPARLRILCLSGEAAAQCLARAGEPVELTQIPLPDAIDGAGKDDDALTRLHAACRAGDHGACQRVLDEDCADESARRELVRARDKHHLTALHHACAAEDAAAAPGLEHVVALLLRLGAPPDARDLAQHTPLHLACLRGHAAAVRKLLTTASSASPPSPMGIGQQPQQQLATARNLGGATPIHYAARAGSTVCLELLLSANARRMGDERYCFDGVDDVDVDGATPLHVACADVHVECVMYLVAANADLSQRDARGRTPLEIACALVNEPARSLQALHIVEKLMAAGAPVVVNGEADSDDDDDASPPPLAIDCVASKAIKRELEVAFLRREARQARRQFRRAAQRLDAQDALVQTLHTTLDALSERHEAAQRVAARRESRLAGQQRQIEQLQLQMKTLVQVIHSGANGAGGGFGAAPGGDVELLSTAPRASAAAGGGLASSDDEGAPPEHGEEDATAAEAARAQDAALARDLGKKCCRERRFALAQTYFERSLDVFALPGVARLLEEAKAMRREAEHKHHRSRGSCVHEATRNKYDDDDGGGKDDGQRLRALVTAMAAAPATKLALLREVGKLEALEPRTSERGAALKWIEWLIALPWDEGTDASGLLSLEASMFDELERMEKEQLERRRHRAARRIQREFRERFAVHLLRRAVASARIQSAYRGLRARRQRQRDAALAITRNRQRDAQHHQGQHDGGGEEEEEEEEEEGDSAAADTALKFVTAFDVNSTVDPCASLFAGRHRWRVVRGVETETATQFAVTQLLALSDKAAVKGGKPLAATEYRVWRRWGTSRADARQSAACGPYDDPETAVVRFERLLRDASTEKQQLQKEPPNTEVWTRLRASAS